MKIAYCSLLLPEEKHITERVKGHLSGVSLHRFTNAINSGLDDNLTSPIKVFNIINTLNYPNFPDLIFHTEKWSHMQGAEDLHIGYINLFGVKYITQEINLKRKLNRWVREQKDDKVILCVHDCYYPSVRAVLKIKKKYQDKIITCLISGDIPGKFELKSQYKDNIKQKLINNMSVKIREMAKEFDSFVLQTKYMAEGFEVENKPVCVVECAFLSSIYTVSSNYKKYVQPEKKIVFYAGSLRKEYDILHLVRAFELIQDDQFELWMAGGGNAEDEIKQYAMKDDRIKFLGFIPAQEVVDRQEAATILVSPRKSDHDYVKYSFPSKTMECLASGKPYIAHKLPCEPEEYREYICYPESETDEDLAKKIVEVSTMDVSKREQIGEASKNFILNKKNPKAICERIVRFWSALIRGDENGYVGK